ncbi:MAG: nickel pincer cofactor biosynthesis protein LarB [Synergistaceae bacterium]|nr:nickel pincer cofactor biosynthesis protein LarB [Synergistaceae bacterium]
MNNLDLKGVLQQVSEGSLTVDDALLHLKELPFKNLKGFEDIGFAKVDLHRKVRQGAAEVIYGAGKTPEQIAAIAKVMLNNNQQNILITRLDAVQAESLLNLLNFKYYAEAKVGVIGGMPEPDGMGDIVIATGGTSDIPVAEEAALTAEVLGNKVKRLYDVGVAGLHRMLAHIDDIMTARVIIAVAGMEGALASVIAGLADCPVIAVPTSIGYGASFNGIAALLAMLNSCASGVTVVNIDNGFGAGYTASMINHLLNNKI